LAKKSALGQEISTPPRNQHSAKKSALAQEISTCPRNQHSPKKSALAQEISTWPKINTGRYLLQILVVDSECRFSIPITFGLQNITSLIYWVDNKKTNPDQMHSYGILVTFLLSTRYWGAPK
jgi:hypothetical protein